MGNLLSRMTSLVKKMAIFVTEGTTKEDTETDSTIAALYDEMSSQVDYMEQTVERMSRAMGVEDDV